MFSIALSGVKKKNQKRITYNNRRKNNIMDGCRGEAKTSIQIDLSTFEVYDIFCLKDEI